MCIRDSSSLAALVAIFFFLVMPEILIGAFLEEEDPLTPEILYIGSILLILASMFQFVDAAQVMALSLLRGLQDTRIPMLIAATSYWLVGIPISYVSGFVWDFQEIGIWCGLVIGLALVAILLWTRFFILTRIK